MVVALAGLLAPAPLAAQTPDPYLGVPILTGGAPTQGGPVTFTNSGTITRTGAGVHGIVGSSTTGGYSEATLNLLRNFSAAPFSYVTNSVLKPDGTAGTLGQAVGGMLVDEDANPLVDEDGHLRPDGSTFTLDEQGHYQFVRGDAFQELVDALQPGESVRTAVRFQVTGTNNDNGVTKVSDGLLVVTVAKDEQGALTQVIGSDYSDFGSSARPELAGDNTVFPDLKTYVTSLLQFSYRGGPGSPVNVINDGTITTSGYGAYGIYVNTVGQNGSNGRDASLFRSSRMGGAGGAGGAITITANGTIATCVQTEAACTGADESPGVVASSIGGNGGTGGDSGWGRRASSGGSGADGSAVTIFGNGIIRTGGARSAGILAQSAGGNGGAGGGGSTFRGAANGANGGAGGTVTVDGSWNIETWGSDSHGIFAKSLGGVAGSGGNGGWTGTSAGGGGLGTWGGTVNVLSDGIIKTHGAAAHGIYAWSEGGHGGAGGSGGSLFYSSGGSGSAAGSGGTVSVTQGANGWIETWGAGSHAIFAQSIGGGGGSGGSGWALVGFGGDSESGGNGGAVTVNNHGTIITHGLGSRGVYAQSIGGGGGDGGNSYGLASFGGQGSKTSDGGTVAVTNTGSITASAEALFAQSIGGGGGNGGSSTGWFSFGGSGGAGGNAGAVSVSSHGSLSTLELNADAIFAQSLGGGGGNGGNSVAVGAFVSVGIGGSGAAGGTGGIARVGVDPASSLTNPTIDPVTGILSTKGENADGIQVQSIGGGGGNGGFAVSVALGGGGAAAFGLGGSGGGGNSAGAASAYFGDSLSSITTKGYKANGIFAQSVGGGGGSGGFSIAAASGQGFSASISIGGNGGTGGAGGAVTVGDALHPILGTITTEGASSSTVAGSRGFANGIFAQSVGGGGGSGGLSIAGGIAPAALNFAMGGKGAGGGAASTVDVTTGATITTKGASSHGVFAQSVGGGGGAGGFSLTVGAAAVNVGVSLGGNGGAGGAGSNVTASNSGLITTMGPLSHGMFAQSVGGGGGAGGFAIAGSLTMSGSLDFALGGKGGTGGNSGTVNVTNSGTITTGFVDTSGPVAPDDPNDPFQHSGRGSKGIVAQSIGGGGGSGGFGGAFSLQFNPTNYPSATLSIGIGGNGGGAGQGGAVSVTNTGTVNTTANDSAGIFAQSAGGGGGDAGFGLAVSLSASAGKNAAVGVAVGGKGGSGGDANTVTVTNSQTITTSGERSEGIFAQSVGGGGGNGGAAISMAAALGTSGSFGGSVAVGGDGAGGGIGQHVTVTNNGTIETSGDHSIGIRAQSIGGGGGNGGLSLSLSASGPPSKTLSVSVGGTGGDGGTGGQVDILGTGQGSIITHGRYAHAIHAQSVGGGGGDGGSATSLSFGVGNFSDTTINVGAAVGGAGGIGNFASTVNVGTVNNYFRSTIKTTGEDAVGIFAQSIGGGGGTGGSAVEGTLTGAPARSGTVVNANIAVGGHGGSGNDGGAVNVYHDGTITTESDGSHGIEAQSIGGGGGNGGSARAVNLQLGTSPLGSRGTTGSLNLSIGASGAGGGDGGTVTVAHLGAITTSGGDAYGIFAQSIGGGGGSGGDGHRGIPGPADDIASKIFRKSSFLKSASVIVGGSQGAFGHGNAVSVSNTGLVKTFGEGSHAVFAQSIGGGGGVGGSGVNTSAGDAELGAAPGLLSLGIGGGGGAGGNGGSVTINLSGGVETYGNGANAIFAESIGGGGGTAGSVDRGFKNWLNIGMGFGLGRDGGSSGNGGAITVTNKGDIFTRGTGSNGIFAHSVGGGGGLVGGLGNEQGGILEPLKYLNFSGSVGGKGSGGTVTVQQTGNITTVGDSADGIFAQSAGGVADETQGGVGGRGDAVSVTLNSGNIIATGADSNGIFAQSHGEAGNGNISVTIADKNSMVIGGSKGAAAVRLADGNQNTITNRGILATADDIEGTAILGTGGHDHVTNWGAVIGSVDLGTGANTFDNKAGAVFLAGGKVSLGTNGLFSNAGMLSLGDSGRMQTTNVSGDFAQSGTPRWLVDFGEIGQSDSLVVSGRAQLGNSITTVDLNEMLLPIGSGSYTLLSAGSGLSGAKFRFGTMYGAMPVGQTFDFANSDTRHELTLLPSVGRFQWTGEMGGDWTTGFVNGISNWTRSGGTDYVYGTPGAGSDVIFTAPGQTFMGADFTINSLTFTGGGSHALVDTHTLTLIGNGKAGVSVGDSATLGVNLVLGGNQSWWNSGYLLVNGPMITGNGRHLTVDGSGTTVIASPIHTGAGSLTKSGSGLLILRGGNTYGGGTTITGGTLLGDTYSLQGNILNDAELVFDQSYGGTFAGDINGSGWLIKQNEGMLRLSGVNTYTGGTLVSGGTLIGNTIGVQGNILNEAQVIFDQDRTGTYAGSMAGNGVLVKQGSGALFMTGNSWPFAGTTTVTGGQLFVNGVLGGRSLTLLPGTLLGGSGVVTNTTIQRGAVLAPGQSVGALQVVGDLRLDPGAIFRVETEAYGLSDAALVSGQMFADGATLDIQALSTKRYRPINFYRMVETGGGFTGTFSNVTSNLGYLDPSLQYNGSTVDLTLRRNDVDFRDMGTRGNQTSVAIALNALVGTATGGLATVVNNVYDLSDVDARDAMGSMTGVLYQFGARVGLDASRAFTSAAMRRLATVSRGKERPLANSGFGVSGAIGQSASADERYGAWFSGFGGVMRYEGSAVDAAAKAPSPGVIGGFDAAVTRTLSLGVTGGRAWPEITLDGRPDRSTARMTHAGAYGRYANGATRIDGALGWSWVDQEGFRSITDGVGVVSAESSNRGNGFMAHVEYGHSFDLGRGFSVEPGAGLQAGQLHLDGFTEQGGDVLALVVPARTARSERLLTGGRISKAIGTFASANMMIEGRAAWAHEFEPLGDVSLRFSADPFANQFAIAPANDQRDSAVLGFSFAADAGAHFRLFADLGGEVGGPSRIWSGMFGLVRTW